MCVILCVINIFSKYPWVVPLKDENCIVITSIIEKVLHKSGQTKQTKQNTCG